jgi:hypothetical protein
MRSENFHKYTILLVVWIISAVYVGGFIDRGWIPHDEGSLAQSAERVLAGELPHRDFDEIYTGGLSFLYAATFKFLGANLISIRYVFFAFFLMFVPALYAIGLRFASPWIAGATTLLGVAWSVPNYFAGLPSWYNLFFAVFGTVALTRHVETQHVGWLFIAGLCGGLSILAKITGIYYVLAGCFVLTFRERFLSRVSQDESTKSAAYTSLKLIAYAIFLSAIAFLLRSRLGAMEIFHFLLPTAAICTLLVWEEWRVGYGTFSSRLRTLFGLLLPFGCGVAIPIGLFLVPYFLTNSLGDFVQGIFVLPQKRFEHASMNFPSILTLAASVPYALLLLRPVAPDAGSGMTTKFQIALIIPLGLAVSSAENLGVYSFLWLSVRSLAVVAVLAGCAILFQSFRTCAVAENQCQILLLLLIMTALVSLIQFPFTAPIYFVYTTPLITLTLLAVVMVQPRAPRLLHAGILGSYFFFAVFWANTGYVWDFGSRYSSYQPGSVLNTERAGIRVMDVDKALYGRMIDLIREHRGSTDYMYATPDCPEVYFLAGMRNPTRAIFDFLSRSKNEPAKLLELLKAKNVNVVAINERPYFSGVLSPKLRALLMDRFPFSVDLGQFTVRWKE